MTRKPTLAVAATLAAAMSLTAAPAGGNDYAFEAVQAEIKASNVATLAVQLVHKPSGKAVTNAVIVQTRLFMVHDGGAEMSSAIIPLPSPKPGVFAFKAPLTMAGRWFLHLTANVNGEPEPVVGKVSFRAIP